MEVVDDDFEIARRLHEELNGSLAADQSLSVFVNQKVANFANNVPILIDSDADDEESIPKSEAQVQRVAKQEEICCDNQQAIAIRREKKSGNDYFMPQMNTYIDLNDNQDWTLVNLESNLQQMFERLKDQYFKMWSKKINYIVKWDTGGVISNNSSFMIFEAAKEVLISTNAMNRPRIQLVSVLLHVMIHLYLNVTSKGAIKLNLHDDNFREIMLYLNDLLSTQISTLHKFPYEPKENEYPKNWYQCTGICQAYEPFHGVIYCTSVPNEAHSFWKEHEEACGGQYFKVFEVQRNNETSCDEKKYVRNVKYMFPKPRDAGSIKGHLKTNLQVRELFDLTNDTEPSAIAQNLCDVIDLDTTDYNTDSATGSQYFAKAKNHIEANCDLCPFCRTKLLAKSKFQSHVDSCRGYQQKVEFKVKRSKR